MNKPQNFFDLPSVLQERLLWDMDLDYDSYESSMAACVHESMNGSWSHTNKLIIANYYKALSVETLEVYLKQELQSLESQVENIKKMLAWQIKKTNF